MKARGGFHNHRAAFRNGRPTKQTRIDAVSSKKPSIISIQPSILNIPPSIDALKFFARLGELALSQEWVVDREARARWDAPMRRTRAAPLIACSLFFALAACGDDTATVGPGDGGASDATTDGSPAPRTDAGPSSDATSGVDATTADAAADAPGEDSAADSPADDANGTTDGGDSAAADADDSAAIDAADASGDDSAAADAALDVGDASASGGDASLDGHGGDDGAADAKTDATDAGSDLDATDSQAPDATKVHDSGEDAADAADTHDADSFFDASGIDAGALCNPFPFAAPQVTITYVDAAAPAPSTFVGGTIESGTYWLTSETSYPGAFGNASTSAEILIVDAVAHTLRNAYADIAPPPTYDGIGYIPGEPAANALTLFLLCPGSGLSQTVYYSFSGTGQGAQLTLLSGDKVIVLTRQ
jgi:hypothetical protein